LDVGLIDVLCSKDDLMSLAEKELQHRLSLPDHGRIRCKQRLRGDLSEAWERQCQEEAHVGWRDLNTEAAMHTLGETLQRLKGKGQEQGKAQGQGDKESMIQRHTQQRQQQKQSTPNMNTGLGSKL